MDSDDLTAEQAAMLLAKVRLMLYYLHQVRERMERRHFPPQDRLKQRVDAAYNAMHALSVDLHYRSCPGKTG